MFLVGRDEHRARLHSVLAAARAARPQTVALRGDPGIGKTSLLEYAEAVADGFRVVRVQGNEAEQDIPFAALSMLVGPLLSEAPGLPAAQAAALDAALDLGPAVHGDRLGVAAATLSVLAAAAESRPLLVTVDDVHLVDAPTLETLAFTLRRLRTEPAAVVMTARLEADVAPDVERWLDQVPTVLVDGLDLASARQLTAHRGVLPVETWQAVGGNPLALLEMSGPHDAAFLDEPIVLSARLMRAYGRRLTALPADTRAAMLLLAAAGRAGDVLDQALAAGDLTRAALEPAEDAGLVVIDRGDARFVHPLIRSTLYHSTSPATRRAAHRALADAYADRVAPGAAERRAFHLAAATPAPDEEVAAQLAAAAAGAAARHNHVTAAALFERAARLSPPGAARAQRTVEAAVAGQAAGLLDSVGPLLDMAIAETDDEHLRIIAQHLQCRVQMWSGQPVQARDQLLDLADRTEEHVPDWSAAMRAQAAIVSIALGEQRLAAAMVEQAATVTADRPDEQRMGVLVAQAVTRAINGDTTGARAVLDRCAPHLPDCDPLSIDQLLVQGALAYAALDDLAPARHWLQTAERAARTAQAVGLLPFQLSWLSLVCWLQGDWQSALAHGHAAVQSAEETGWTTELPNCLVALATAEVTLGQDDAARGHLADAAELGAKGGSRLFAAHRSRLLGLLELGAGRPAEAAEHLQAAGEFAVAQRMGDSVLFNWAGDLVEALVRAGRADQVGVARRALAQEVARSGRPTEAAIAARCDGLLADSLDAGRSAFEAALGWHEHTERPFEQARTRFCYGELLRRHQLRAESRVQLGAALEAFTRLGATAWARRAETELRATGLTARRRPAGSTQADLGSLTPRELRVAMAVGRGATNAEAAAELFLSRKTVEYHLSNIYRKLEIRTRAELARLMASG
ncbi:AAA family ATPase [Pseudonocardia sp. CA-107938]|uniref:helix-turn-helix transcriptional regulator n=1 Tax=Pseudonocardia sp. CA-107938 TaxID=3240021 RepID=UPI003D8AE672